MRHVSHAPGRDGGGPVLDDDRPVDRDDPGRSASDRSQTRHKIFPLSLRASLVLVLLAPITATVGFASTTALARWSSRSQAVTAHSATLELDAFMRARAAVADEYVPTAAIVYAAADHVSPTTLQKLLGIDFVSELATARRTVDQQAVLRTTASLAPDYRELLSLRRSEAQGKVSFAEAQGFFAKFGAAIDTRWLTSFTTLSAQTDSSAPLAIRSSLAVLSSAYTAFTAGLEEATLAQGVLTAPATSAQVEALIVAKEQFASSVEGFPGRLGPQAAAAWDALMTSPQISGFDASVELAVQVGLGHETPPYATSIEAHATVFKGDVERAAALTSLVRAADADLLGVTAFEENVATRGFVIDLLTMALLLVVALGGVLILTRAAGRPLARIVRAAGAVRAGDFDLPPLDESGPKELALAAGAFNEMSSTLRAVEAHAVALAENDLDNPLLRSPLPGRTGRAFQVTFDQLHDSMLSNEAQRDLLHERATHDSLTGLLNRGAAVEALDRDLARARRGDQVLALLFIDLDGLKAINDTFGHEGGDAAIRAVADALRTTTRQGDIVARLGGDEFVVAWLGAPDPAGPSRLAERIRQRVSATVVELGGERIQVGCSIGIALSGPEDVAVDTVMSRADQALYVAKAESGAGGAGPGRRPSHRIASSRAQRPQSGRSRQFDENARAKVGVSPPEGATGAAAAGHGSPPT